MPEPDDIEYLEAMNRVAANARRLIEEKQPIPAPVGLLCKLGIIASRASLDPILHDKEVRCWLEALQGQGILSWEVEEK